MLPSAAQNVLPNIVGASKSLRPGFHVFYEHPEQVFRSGEFDRYVWLEDDRWTTEDYVSWAFFTVSCVLMVKAFLPDLFWGFMEYLSLGLLYTPLIVV